jgi:hypothetical protein
LASISGGSRSPSVSKDKVVERRQAKGWSAAAIWKVLTKNKEISCSYKTFVAHVRRLQRQTITTEPSTPKKRKEFIWDSTPNKEELI